jgi:phosphoglycerate dehydrogenase-like enzyme
MPDPRAGSDVSSGRTQSLILFDPFPRAAPLILAGDMLARFESLGRVVGLAESAAGKLPAALVDDVLPDVDVIVGQTDLGSDRLARASKLRAVINVEGNFGQNVDYAECFRRGIQVLSIAPVFAQAVAEMALGMAIDLARGITTADRLFREGKEQYGLAGNRESFVIRGETMSFIGCGNLGRALLPLLHPFRPRLLIHDPWLPDSSVRELGAKPVSLDAALSEARVIFVLAGVTEENRGALDRAKLELIRADAVLLLMSRAGIVDFEALTDLVAEGRFRAATDVFPIEPAPADLHARTLDGLLLSAHRAGGLPSVLAGIGEMVVDDLSLILRGLPPQRLQAARPETVARWRNPPGRSYAPGTRI